MFLSIIVPVYNMAADDRLKWCMDSLVGQTLAQTKPGEWEILAVDDASTDASPAILADYEKRYPGLVRVIISPENRHQGGAKNLGLAEARGEWIGFIDADDWIVPDYYERLLAEAARTGADMAGCDYCLVHEHTRIPTERVPCNSKAQTGELDKEKYQLLLLDCGSLVTKVYRREVIFGTPADSSDGISAAASDRHGSRTFPEGIFYEDNAVANTWMLRAKRFAYIPEPLYFYYQHDASTVHTLSERNLNDRMEAGRLMLAAAKEGGYLEAYRPEIEFMFTNLFYRNTLFSAMAVYREGKKGKEAAERTAAGGVKRQESVCRFTARLAKEMRETFPDFAENPYYRERIDAEERGFMALQMRSQLLFYIKYRLLWLYRNLRRR
ncbi:MAG: glycosyltransferase [Lachnospiraceae bacterium]|nr:glycosyltransferase [Lachnospiraceae bacterium]